MNIISTQNRAQFSSSLQARPMEQKAAEPAPQEPQESYSAWDPVKNAGVVGAAIAVPAALGAVCNSLFPNAGTLAKGAMMLGSATALGVGAGLWAVKGGKEEFNGHPILTGMTGLLVGGAGMAAGALLSPIGLTYGWTGVAVAAGVGAVGAGVISAVGIQAATKKA